MKSRLAKKIIKASVSYCFYCRHCDTHSRFKYHPYWTSHWYHYGFLTGDVPSIYIEYLECCQDKANGAEKNTAAQVVGTGESQTER